MLQSLLVYGGLMFVMVLFSHTAYQFSNSKYKVFQENRYVPIICVILLFSFVFGARWGVGIDHPNYLRIFQNYCAGYEERDTLEPGFVLLNKFLAYYGFHFFFLFFIFALIQISFFVASFRTRKYLLPFALLILMTSYFMGWMNIMRQETVVCIFIWLILTIEKRTFLNYLVWILVCTLCFHKSAFILIPFYFFIKNGKSYSGSISFQVIIFFISLWMGVTHYMLTKFANIDQFALMLGYEQYADPELAEKFFKEDFNWGPRSWINAMLVFYTIILSGKVKSYFKDSGFVSVYNLFFWGSCCTLICAGIDVISRIFIYFSALNIVIYTFTLFYVFKNRRQGRRALINFLVYAGLNFLVFLGTLYAVTLQDGATRFIFFWQAEV